MERMWRVIRYEQVGSTNEVCKALAARGADDTAVTALTQTAGKGRLGRSFQSPEGGLYLSVLWRGCPAGQLFTVTPLAAVAVCRAIEQTCGAVCGIKWCNDVVLDGKKLCGILTESHLRPDGSAEWLVVGIGLNLTTTPADWPEHGMAQLHALGFKTAAMALSDRSVSIDDNALAAEPKLAIVLGTEGDGLAHSTIAACDYTVRIPMHHGVDSLNVAAASAVAFYQLGKPAE